MPRWGQQQYDFYAHVGEALESIQKVLMDINVWDKPVQDVSTVDLRGAVGAQRTNREANIHLFNQQLSRAGWLPITVPNLNALLP